MLNSDLAKPEVDLTVCDYTDIPMHVSLITYEYIFDPWSNDSRYIYSHEQMQREIDELNALIKSKVPWISVFFISSFSYFCMVISTMGMFIFHKCNDNVSVAFVFACIFIIAFVHYVMCIVCRYLITRSVIEAIETKVKELNNKYDCEQIHFKFINFSGLGFKYLKFLPKFKDKIYFTLRVVYRYCKII
ncbi:conserved Plasmodium protein, unknown function [Plasmodium ovale]|uniref:Uncharacterized protein n=1 Tax=Plasmodium ovale TaxID=36330 RepID=A0A1D3TH26_PLAOA|nr:conserved Plasmodium protein, unknown function [Plasmodium ovale]